MTVSKATPLTTPVINTFTSTKLKQSLSKVYYPFTDRLTHRETDKEIERSGFKKNREYECIVTSHRALRRNGKRKLKGMALKTYRTMFSSQILVLHRETASPIWFIFYLQTTKSVSGQFHKLVNLKVKNGNCGKHLGV